MKCWKMEVIGFTNEFLRIPTKFPRISAEFPPDLFTVDRPRKSYRTNSDIYPCNDLLLLFSWNTFLMEVKTEVELEIEMEVEMKIKMAAPILQPN